MKRIGETKIGKLTPKPHLTYPLIRLPSEYGEVIGKKAQIFETEYEGNRAFLIVVAEEVIKPDNSLALEKRLEELENQIRELKEVVIKGNPTSNPLNSKNSIAPGGFEPPSPAPKAGMIDRYTTGLFGILEYGCHVNVNLEF